MVCAFADKLDLMLMEENPTVQQLETKEGGMIFQIPLNAFPGFWAFAYLVLVDDYVVLIDTGSNFHTSNQNLDQGFEQISEVLGKSFTFSDLTHIFITHGHIDHFAGLAHVRPTSDAKVGVHELDLRNLTNYEERLVIVSKRLRSFLLESGVPTERVGQLLEMYMMPKALFNSVEVDFTYEAVGMEIGPFTFFHTPGHCAGAVVIKLHDILFTGDHILSDITPHQSPERLTLNTGLETYVQSLAFTKSLSKDITTAFGGHKPPIMDVNQRVDQIISLHKDRLTNILHILEHPNTVVGISKTLFGSTEGYNALLAIEEAGAHIQYLYQRGFLAINNLDAIQKSEDPIPIEYRWLEKGFDPKKIFPGKLRG
jgi:glyoxylase-like metal-dependent hydrolase (beta-lactamase superfamily II)